MAFKKFLSRLFGQNPKEDSKELQPEPLEIREAESHETITETEEEPPERLAGSELLLPLEHPLTQLWNLYAKEREHQPLPSLVLTEVPDPEYPEPSKEQDLLLSAEAMKQELPRLERFVTNAVTKRLTKLNTPEDEPLPVLNAEAMVFMPGNRMTAWLLAFPPVGEGAELNTDILTSALTAAQVTYGIDEALLESLPQSPDRYFHLYLVARGQMPVHGKDGYVMDLVSRNPVKTLVEDDSGRVDYAALDLFQNAKKGDIICRIFPPTECRDGMTVLGQTLSARSGRKAIVPKGRNTELSEAEDALIASCEGHVEFNGRSFQIKPVLEISGNVDFSTGNIKSLGDVHIHGDVCSGFTVRAAGSITVDGVVEACTIEAGGDLIVRKGVQGNNRAIIRAHRNIFAKYLESSSVYTRENLQTECIINCDVCSDNIVKVRSGRGTILGGQIHAANEISANIVGARSECLTVVVLGGRPCEEFEREVLAKEIDDLAQEMEKVERQPESPAKLRQLSKLRVQLASDKLKLRQLNKELDRKDSPEEKSLENPYAEYDEKFSNGQLICDIVYPGTEITINKTSLRVTNETRRCRASLKGGIISLTMI